MVGVVSSRWEMIAVGLHAPRYPSTTEDLTQVPITLPVVFEARFEETFSKRSHVSQVSRVKSESELNSLHGGSGRRSAGEGWPGPVPSEEC
ncbi:unnamed protein product [Arctogadus glacialis]